MGRFIFRAFMRPAVEMAADTMKAYVTVARILQVHTRRNRGRSPLTGIYINQVNIYIAYIINSVYNISTPVRRSQ